MKLFRIRVNDPIGVITSACKSAYFSLNEVDAMISFMEKELPEGFNTIQLIDVPDDFPQPHNQWVKGYSSAL